MLELNKWTEIEEESISDADRLAFLKNFTDAATLDIMKSQILAEKKWAAQVRKELKRNDLTRAERLYYRKQQVRLNLSNQIIDNAIEAQRKLAKAIQRKTETKQELAAVNQTIFDVNRTIDEAKQKLRITVIDLLKEGSFTGEEIAKMNYVDIKRVQEIIEGEW